jgi:adenine-specific DNA methylase
MSNKKQTAVEWLVSNISSKIDNEYWCNQKEITEWVEQAKAMEKEQIMDAFINGEHSLGEDGEQYYNETYEQ